MSKIGKQPIVIPDKVEVKIENGEIWVKGPKGELRQKMHPQISVDLKGQMIEVSPRQTTKQSAALWGLIRALVFNMVKGVTEGFEKKLEIEGVGYKAAAEENKLILSLGFSHLVVVEMPVGIEFKVEKNMITVSGIDKQLVGQTAASIRAKKKPEPYKGKGIHYQGEVIRRKAGKKAMVSVK